MTVTTQNTSEAVNIENFVANERYLAGFVTRGCLKIFYR
jgi:hypothetical protein